MKLSDFNFDLPNHLIARYPTEQRTASRLLHMEGVNGHIEHRQFPDVLSLLNRGDLLIFNNTRVIPARLLGRKETGGKVEVLVERMLNENKVLAHVRASKSPKEGTKLQLEEHIWGTVLGRQDALFEIEFEGPQTVLELLETYGHMPLPPYIDRADEETDKERYQTVYNEKPGAVAAPTAGLHFDDELLQKLTDKGIEQAFVTLHVGAGTFQPVRVDNILEHKMHSEYAEVPQEVIDAIIRTKEKGGRVIAVGTTSVRSIESAAQESQFEGHDLQPFFGDTNIFIYPGYEFLVIDALITNFHLPESTLMMLVSAFAGSDNIKNAYQQAIEQEYRFFSYGDSMFLEKK